METSLYRVDSKKLLFFWCSKISGKDYFVSFNKSWKAIHPCDLVVRIRHSHGWIPCMGDSFFYLFVFLQVFIKWCRCWRSMYVRASTWEKTELGKDRAGRKPRNEATHPNVTLPVIMMGSCFPRRLGLLDVYYFTGHNREVILTALLMKKTKSHSLRDASTYHKDKVSHLTSFLAVSIFFLVTAKMCPG